jgi:hypothetical protein
MAFMRSRSITIFLLIASLPGAALASDVYKCTNAQGSVTFQDQPCRTGDSETPIHIAKPPPAPTVTSDAEAATTAPPPTPAPAASPPQPHKALPPLWVCTRPEDGTHYVSRDGATPPRMVPAGVLGIPDKPLASAYGPGGIGVSAPGVRKIPVDSSPQAAIAGAYVAIQDTCEPATPEQTCDYLRGQYDKVHEKLRGAFKDEQAVLQPQQDELDDQLDGC